jgi:hypothetical protein
MRAGLCRMLHMDFYEKAFFVKPTWRLYIRGRAQRLPLATLLFRCE